MTIWSLSHWSSNWEDPLLALLDTGAPPRLELSTEQRAAQRTSTNVYANHTALALPTTLLCWAADGGR